MQLFGGLFGGGGGGPSRGGINALQVALLAGQVVNAVATIDANGDGKIEPHEIAATAAKVVKGLMAAFPEYAAAAGDPATVREMVDLQVRFIMLATGQAKGQEHQTLGPGSVGTMPYGLLGGS